MSNFVKKASPAFLLVLLAVFLSASDLAAAGKPSSSPLNAKVTADPWGFRLVDGKGKGVLSEFPSTGDSPAGTLGFRVGDTWQHATRVISSSAAGSVKTWRLATTDPSRDLDVALEPAGSGSVRLKAEVIGSTTGIEAIGMGFKAPTAERYLGFGERSNAVNQRGNVVESWAAEGPYRNSEAVLVSGSFVPAWGFRSEGANSRPDSTYFPMPWLLSTAGYGVLLEDTRPSYFRIGSDRPDAWSVEVSRKVEGLANQPADPPSPGSISLRFFAGPKPADALQRLTAAIGRQPATAPWFLGPWVQSKGGDQVTADTLRSNDIPTSVMQTYAHYLPCGGQNPQEETDRTNLFHSNGMAVTTYFNPMVCTGYNPVFNDLKNAGGLTLKQDGQPYTYKYLSYNVGETDFTSPAGRDTYGGLLHTALDAGYDGWMEDFGEYHPPDSKVSDGTPGMVAHNRYPRDYHCAAYDKVKDAGRPVLRYVRSGYTGSAACSPVVWGGDPSTEWDFDGLKSAITNGLTMGLSGVGVWGSDIGGFFSILSPDLTPELLTRWIQFGAFSGVMRDQADGYLAGSNRGRAQVLAPEQIQIWRRYSKLRTQLYPYIQGATAEYRSTGMPVMRALALQYPGDSRAAAVEDQYMFGPDLMVAPVTEPKQTGRRLYLPKGRWFDFWRSLRVSQASGFRLDLVRSSRVNGGGWWTVPAPADRIPVLARAGTMLVTLPDSVDTLSPYGTGQTGIDRLDDTADRRLLVLPAGRKSARFEARGRIYSNEYSRRGIWRLAIRDTRPRRWQIQAALGSLNRPFRPRCLKINGRKTQLRYRSTGRLLKINFKAKSRRTTIVVSRKPCR
ncbi:MAG: hypothetical protein M9938_01580 [Solirubrobacterales bacterium]|nr:hypothetical protein [Solirubrobacterales bacterium]